MSHDLVARGAKTGSDTRRWGIGQGVLKSELQTTSAESPCQSAANRASASGRGRGVGAGRRRARRLGDAEPPLQLGQITPTPREREQLEHARRGL